MSKPHAFRSHACSRSRKRILGAASTFGPRQSLRPTDRFNVSAIPIPIECGLPRLLQFDGRVHAATVVLQSGVRLLVPQSTLDLTPSTPSPSILPRNHFGAGGVTFVSFRTGPSGRGLRCSRADRRRFPSTVSSSNDLRTVRCPGGSRETTAGPRNRAASTSTSSAGASAARLFCETRRAGSRSALRGNPP